MREASDGLTKRRLSMNLALTPGIGGKTLTRILARMDLLGTEPKEFLRLSPEALQESFGLKPKQARQLLSASEAWLGESEGMETWLAANDVHVITAADAHYPSRLEQFDPDPPGVLFCYGNLRLLERATFSVLSSRRTTLRGLEWIEKLTEEGVFRSEVLVAGHDRPEYQRAAIVPLRWGAPRILCFDRGLQVALGDNLKEEPFRAGRLWRYEFDPKTDLAISPFKPKGTFHGVHNQVRDRLIAGFSDRIDFVEVAPGGHMERLARMALQAGRKVRVSDRADIVHQLKAAGAEVVPAG